MERQAEQLAGRHILVTGAASGMGEAIARRFAQAGAAVALVDLREDAVRPVADAIGQHAFAADVSDPQRVAAAVEAAVGAMGALDGIVNAAGILQHGAFEHSEAGEADRVLAVNLSGPMYICRAALPHLRAAPRATIVNISSMAAVRPPPYQAAYAASKAGLVAFGVALAGELGPTIRLNTLCPGVIRTPMIERLFESGTLSDELMHQIAQLGRAGTPEEVAETTLFLTSDQSSFISASTLTINGGQLT